MPARHWHLQDIDHSRIVLTAEAQGYLGKGSPEAQVFAAVPPEGISLAEIKVGGGSVRFPPRSPMHRRSIDAAAAPCAAALGWRHCLSMQSSAHPGTWPHAGLPRLPARALPAAPQKQLGAAGDVGFKQAMQSKWVAIDKCGGEPRVVRKVESVQDRVLEVLTAVAEGKVRGMWGMLRVCALGSVFVCVCV